MQNIKVISGGQTGIDRMGLEVAKSLNIPTGGYAPKNFLTENGPDHTLKDVFGLVDSGLYYAGRTKLNVQASHGTILFGNDNSTGSLLTLSCCKECQKPYIINPATVEIIAFIKEYKISILNIAGNRISKLTKVKYDYYYGILYEALKNYSSQ